MRYTLTVEGKEILKTTNDGTFYLELEKYNNQGYAMFSKGNKSYWDVYLVKGVN